MLKIIVNKIIAHSSNFTKGRKNKIEFIVIHYTGNNGDTAKNNCNYFKKANRNASAHYFLDENEICQSVLDEDTAWHCGTKGQYYHNKCRNSNSIGIEICAEKDTKGNFYFNEKTLANAVKLTKYLMKKYNIPIKNILRHYDITRKICPAPFVENNIAWNNFKNKLKDNRYMKVKRIIEFNGTKKELDAINYDGKNYYSIAEIAKLIGKNVSYDKNTKITKLY